MKLYIYNDGKCIKEFEGVQAHGLKTMYLGIPKRCVLMFNHVKNGTIFNGSIDLLNNMTFALY